MNAVVTQVHCPFCNAAQPVQSAGAYTCEFCLQPFNVQDAKREEARLLDEIRAWVEQRVGAAGAASGVDLASRGYIFQQKVLPDLRRDVDRALERLGGYGQFALVTVPVRVPVQQSHQPNPLVAYRREILGLKGLKARLSSENVTSFATRDADKVAIRYMDRHLSSLVHLSNVAEAAAWRTPEGYAAARKNLETLAAEVAWSVATEGAQDPALGAFLGALQQRYGALAEICRICEEAGSGNAISGAALASRAEATAAALSATAHRVEASNYAPADTMPVVVAVHQESASARALARWLRAYEYITGHSQAPFPAFVADVDPLTGGGSLSPESQAELLDAVAFVLSAARGSTGVPVVADFSWVGTWAETSRQKKSLGMFGVEEQIASVDQFLSPFWVADVTFSRAQGTVFTSGQEQRTVALLDACNPSPQRVVVLGDGPLAQALNTQGSLLGAPVAMPRSSPTQASTIMMQGLRGRPDYLNPRLRIRGLAFLASAAATYTGGQTPRIASTCLNGQVPVDDFARTQVQTTQQLLQRYG
jgi:hypothetical protein